MTKILASLSVVVSLLVLASCQREGKDLGTCQYYPAFLWTDTKTTPCEHTVDFDFSDDARADRATFADFVFTHPDGRRYSPDTLIVTADGQRLTDGVLHVTPTTTSVRLAIAFAPEAEGGNYQGALRLVDHSLDRLDSQTLAPGQQVDAFQWNIEYDKRMNPLKEALLWALAVTVAALAVWFIALRPIFYPHFGYYTKTILLYQGDRPVWQRKVRFKGARAVVLASKARPQSMLQRLFAGKVLYVECPQITAPLTLRPKPGKKAFATGAGYIVRPNPIPRQSVATAENRQQNIKIQIN